MAMSTQKSKVNLIGLLAGLLGVFSLGCFSFFLHQNSTEQTENFNSQEVSKYSNYGIELTYPKNWKVQQFQPNEFTQTVAELIPPDRNSTELINPKILVEVRPLNNSPSLNEAKNEATKAIKKYLPNSKIIESRSEKLDGYPSYFLVYTGLNEQNSLKRMQVGILKNEQLYVLIYEAKTRKYNLYEDTVLAIVESTKLSQ
jgi:eukaryotic-like serine/threonine-protein kinase